MQRAWTITQEYLESPVAKTQSSEQAILRSAHKAVHAVSKDLEDMGFNTAIAILMEYVNELYKLKAKFGFDAKDDWKFALERLVLLLAPFAPHIAEELWQQLGHEKSIHTEGWPSYDETFLVSDTITIAVQVNGKLRATIEVASGSDEASIVATAKVHENIKAHLSGEPKRVIYVPNKLLNLVG